MKKIIGVIALASFIMVAGCHKKETVSKQDTEAAIAGMMELDTATTNSEAYAAYKSMPEDMPITLPINTKGVMLEHNLPLPFVGLVQKLSHLGIRSKKALPDSAWGVYQYDYAYDVWNHISKTPQDTVILLWVTNNKQDSLVVSNLKFANAPNDTVITSCNFNLFVDSNEEAHLYFSSTVNDSAFATAMHVELELINIVRYTLDANAASGHNLADSVFYGTITATATNLINNNNFSISLTHNTDESGSVNVTWNKGSDEWAINVNLSVPQTVGTYQKYTVSGEIKKNNTHAASIEGVIWDPEDASHRSYINIIYPDGSTGSLYVGSTSAK